MLARPLHIQVCLGARARGCVCVWNPLSHTVLNQQCRGAISCLQLIAQRRGMHSWLIWLWDARVTYLQINADSQFRGGNRLSLEPEQFPQLITYALDLAGFDLGILKASITSTFLYVPFQSTHSISTVNGHSLTDLSAVCQLCGVHWIGTGLPVQNGVLQYLKTVTGHGTNTFSLPLRHPQECVCPFPLPSCFSCLAAVFLPRCLFCFALLLFCLPGLGSCALSPPSSFPPFSSICPACLLCAPLACSLPLWFCSHFPIVLLLLAVLVPFPLPSSGLCVWSPL